MIRILYRNGLGELNAHLQVNELTEALKDPTGLLWIDMANVPIETVEPILLGTFGFHPLAIDDAVHESHLPKVDDWQEYLYVVLRAVDHVNVASFQLQVPELDVFLGSNFVVSYYQELIAAVDRVWDLIVRYLIQVHNKRPQRVAEGDDKKHEHKSNPGQDTADFTQIGM